METKKKRLTLALAPDMRERLHAAAARKGVSVGQYCKFAIEGELARDDLDGDEQPKMTIDDLIARQKRIYGDRVLPGSSVDLIREAREERDRQMESW